MADPHTGRTPHGGPARAARSHRRPMRVACIGGGPGGLYFAALFKRLAPDADVTVWERNAPDDTFGFGVVFSEEALGGVAAADPVVYEAMAREFARWDDLDVHYRGEVITCGGHGFAAMSRRRLLAVLQDRCRELGVRLRFGRPAPPAGLLAAEHDLVVASDGVHSATRDARSAAFGSSVTPHRCRYIWLGTDLVLDAFRFDFVPTEHGVMQLHAYPYSADASTFVVEMRDEVWRAAGLDRKEPVTACERLFAHVLAGHRLFGGAAPHWTTFHTVANSRWRDGNIVLLGDAAHTVHFSTGSGTKLALEDAFSLATALHEQPTVDAALEVYEAERRPVAESLGRAGRASLEWFENVALYLDQPPLQFAFNLLSRSRRVTHANLRLRDPEFTARVERACGVPAGTPPMFTELTVRQLTLRNRVVVSPMDMCSAAPGPDSAGGEPGDFHLVHLGARALGGAGLVMTGMAGVGPEGRLGPGGTGLWNHTQTAGWRRVTDFVHAHTGSAIGVQLGHAGLRSPTHAGRDGPDRPLPADGPTPWALTRTDLARIRDEFVRAARRAARAGFDLLELQYAHGSLLSAFLSPLTNRRADAYGGSPAARLRFPLEVLDAVRQDGWPDQCPLAVRVSATDWAEGGNTGDDAVEIARALAGHGADLLDVSSGQVVPDERPDRGRLHNSGFADRIRHAASVPVVAVGAITSYDDVNSLILAGRADLCALGRPHLYDPHWTLHAAAEQGYTGPGALWPVPYRPGGRPPHPGRVEARRAHPPLRPDPAPAATRHRRWRNGLAP
ncbi:FAD-dependent monooxygenase [Kitasatospora sp. NPDC059795]|uniref:oxidoreductase n=1 Tax=Kitasatospora sp. NPDC059795 TaxID=3346949 RepID=UPI0036640729